MSDFMGFKVNIGFPPFSATVDLSIENSCSVSLSEEYSSNFTIIEEYECIITLGN